MKKILALFLPAMMAMLTFAPAALPAIAETQPALPIVLTKDQAHLPGIAQLLRVNTDKLPMFDSIGMLNQTGTLKKGDYIWGLRWVGNMLYTLSWDGIRAFWVDAAGFVGPVPLANISNPYDPSLQNGGGHDFSLPGSLAGPTGPVGPGNPVDPEFPK